MHRRFLLSLPALGGGRAGREPGLVGERTRKARSRCWVCVAKEVPGAPWSWIHIRDADPVEATSELDGCG